MAVWGSLDHTHAYNLVFCVHFEGCPCNATKEQFEQTMKIDIGRHFGYGSTQNRKTIKRIACVMKVSQQFHRYFFHETIHRLHTGE